jgi:thiamine biosynthesis lipoprotein
MPSVRLALAAMATRFELLLLGEDPVHLRAAGEEALREIRRIEGMCNFYDPSSELSRVNREAADRPVRLSGAMTRLLATCRTLVDETAGRFDPTVAPALASWGLRHRNTPGRTPSPDELDAVRSSIGFARIQLDEERGAIHLPGNAMQLDLGGIAKGWALDEARFVLEEAGVEHALLHGGTSTVIGIGQDEEGAEWQVGIEDPYPSSDEARDWIMEVALAQGALSVSGIHGKAVSVKGKSDSVGHIIQPWSGRAVSGRRLSLVTHPLATHADAWSTALLADPEWSPPDTIRGTTFLKTDSGWTVTAGRPPSDGSFLRFH